MATFEEIAQYKAYEEWLANQQNVQGPPDPSRVNPLDTGSGPDRRTNREMRRYGRKVGRMDEEELVALMGEQQRQNIAQAKDEGLLGGRGESSRNPGGRNNHGLDWVRRNYNPDNNPFEGRNPQAEAAAAVSRAKADQLARHNETAANIYREGTLSRDIGGANMTSFYGADRGDQAAAYAIGNPTQPVMNVLNLPDGGMGYGSSMPLPQADLSLLLPTGGYNPQAGVGGSGVPMTAGEAQGTDLIGPGIYGERDRSNPASQDAIMARQALAQAGINQRLKEFYENPFAGPQAPQQAAEAPRYVPPQAPPTPVPQAQPNLNQYMDFSPFSSLWDWLSGENAFAEAFGRQPNPR